jgi:probable rRNA maturation factor
MTLRIEIADEQVLHPIDHSLVRRIKEVVKKIAKEHGYAEGEISIAVIDDAGIHRLNREFLQHDWPTDVITFPLSDDENWLDGEIVVSRETADRLAINLPWSGDDELLLYVIHGTLHLVGFDDQDEGSSREMKIEEKRWLIEMKVPQAELHE